MKYGIVKDIWNGVLMGAAVSAMLFGAAKVNAAGAKEGIPEAYIQYCREAGSVYRVCPELLEAIMEEESGGNPDAVGSAGEIGLMQVDPKYHKGRGERLNVCDLNEPRGNIFVGADYLAELFLEYGDVGTVLMVYNGTKHAAERGKRGDYTEYAKRIMERSRHLEQKHGK